MRIPSLLHLPLILLLTISYSNLTPRNDSSIPLLEAVVAHASSHVYELRICELNFRLTRPPQLKARTHEWELIILVTHQKLH